jgi:hypothetical protein
MAQRKLRGLQADRKPCSRGIEEERESWNGTKMGLVVVVHVDEYETSPLTYFLGDNDVHYLLLILQRLLNKAEGQNVDIFGKKKQWVQMKSCSRVIFSYFVFCMELP